MDRSCILPASVDNLYQMLQFVSMNALKAGFEQDQVLQIELALEEAIVNIIEHGSSAIIKIQCNPIDAGIQVKLIDAGIPFNPLQSIPENPIGGYGIPLIRKIMDKSEYEYKDDSNILTLNKFRSILSSQSN